MKTKIDTVFVVLVYRNYNDLNTFFDSLKLSGINSYKVIVVNSYYDNNTEEKIKEIALANESVFISTPNNGYGAGNNKGIQYAIEHYDFKLLVVSNPDVEIDYFNENLKYSDEVVIYAPKIIRNDGRNQNPMRIKYSKLSDALAYFGYIHNSKLSLYAGILLTKLDRFFREKRCVNIYEAHGSFVIFTNKAIFKLSPVFDENIFLFCEESDLGHKAAQNNIRIIYDRQTRIRHHEDGSMKLSDINLNNTMKESFIYYYKKWCK